MVFETVKSKIEEWLTPFLDEKGFFLVDVKISAGKKIEVYVDSDTGIQIHECATVSRFLEGNLDGSGLVPENYTLEVSSPGMSNPLRVPRQYKRRIGRELEILKPNGEKFVAQLIAVSDNDITVKEKVEETKKKKKNDKAAEEKEVPKELTLKYSEIKSASLVFNF